MDKEKYVDESWKEQASQEKNVLSQADTSDQEKIILSEEPADNNEETVSQPKTSEHELAQNEEIEINFLNYITSLGFQAMIFMGEVPNPQTNKAEKNLTQAKFLIDTLIMLKEKTIGNLSDQEKDLLENSIYELQLRFVQVSKHDESSDNEEKE